MIYDETAVVTEIRRITLTELRLWVQEGWVRPAAGAAGPVFDEMDIARLRLVCDLRADLSLPDDAVSMLLSLIDQVHGLRRELRCLAEAVEAQPEPVRRAVIAAYRDREAIAE